MKVRAVQRHARMAPRKIRPLATLVRGMSVGAAEDQLAHLPGKAPSLVNDVLKSAVANAIHNHNLEKDTLKIVDIRVDEGLVMKRWQPAAKGMAHPRLKRMSHITVVVDGEATAKKKPASRRAASIKTISASEYAAMQQADEGAEDETKKEAVPTAEKNNRAAAQQPRPVETVKDKEEHEAFQKNKMNQMGGDKKKTHRRKSIG